jgi:transcriptional regulator with XRE-family HTH domain
MLIRQLTSAEQVRIQQSRGRIATGWSEMIARDQLRNEARMEATLSGGLRRAIHDSPLSLSALARHFRVDPMMLDEFLTGERTLRSDVLDRLAGILGYDLTPARAGA